VFFSLIHLLKMVFFQVSMLNYQRVNIYFPTIFCSIHPATSPGHTSSFQGLVQLLNLRSFSQNSSDGPTIYSLNYPCHRRYTQFHKPLSVYIYMYNIYMYYKYICIINIYIYKYVLYICNIYIYMYYK
jgi:hypothetical protein